MVMKDLQCAKYCVPGRLCSCLTKIHGDAASASISLVYL